MSRRLAVWVLFSVAALASSSTAGARSGAGPLAPLVGTTEGPDAAAIAAYRRGDVESARTLWLALLEEAEPALAGRERARVLYDLGNAAARLERWGEATGWYTAALRLAPRDGDAWANLELARVEAGLDPADRGDLAATARRLLDALTPAESAWLALGALVPLAAALAFEALRGGALARRLSLAAALAALAGAAPFVRHALFALDDPVLVIAERPIDARSEPREGAARQAELAPGDLAERVDELPGWIRVTVPDGPPAWIPAEAGFPLVR